MSPPVFFNYSSEYSCEIAAEVYKVSLDDFFEWNPTLKNQTDGECELDPAKQYCAQKRRVESEGGSTSYCVQYEFAEPGYNVATCDSYLDIYGADEASFGEWNSGTTCDSFETGTEPF